MIPADPSSGPSRAAGDSSGVARHAGLSNAAGGSAPGRTQTEPGARVRAILWRSADATLGRPPRRVRGIRQTCPISVELEVVRVFVRFDGSRFMDHATSLESFKDRFSRAAMSAGIAA